LYLEESVRGGLVLTNCVKRGISVVLFYSSKCQHCTKLIPIFKKLPGHINGVQFALSLVTPEIAMKSNKTISPIQYVPLIILFVNGRPFVRYDGAFTENDIKSFIIDYGNKISARERDTFQQQKRQNQQQIHYQNQPQSKKNISNDIYGIPYNSKKHQDIPDYINGIGVPKRDDVTYLEFDDAYEKNKA
jgi:thiol-disulfide isomerase/thioredoxin